MKFRNVLKKILVVVRTISAAIVILLTIYVLSITRSIWILEFINVMIAKNIYSLWIISIIVFIVSASIVVSIEGKEKESQRLQQRTKKSRARSNFRIETGNTLIEIGQDLKGDGFFNEAKIEYKLGEATKAIDKF
jgi:hypothetical protein